MKTRMEKYYKQDLSNFQRTKKNKDLYKQMNLGDDFNDLPVSDNYVELDIKDIKKGITSREDYKKAKELGHITNKKVKATEDEMEEEIKEEKIYDINKMLEKARSNKKEDDKQTDYLSDKYLKSLEEFTKENNFELLKDKQEITNDRNKEIEEKMKETASLSLDILSDLKPDENTIVTTPIKEEVEDKTFYSGTYTFTKEDFENKEEDNDFADIEGKHTTLKVILLAFGILICTAMVILGYWYFK